MKDSDIQLAIASIMEQEGLSRTRLITRLKHHVDSGDANVSLRAVEMGLKLHDSFPAARNMVLNATIDVSPLDLSKYT